MSILRTLEKLYVVSVLLFLTGIGEQAPIAANGLAGRMQPQIWENIGRLIVCGTLLPLLIIHRKKVMDGLRHSGWLIALCGVALASTAWSFDPRFTLRHAIFLCVVTLLGILIATAFSWDEQLTLFGWMSVLVVWGCAFTAVFIPSYGIAADAHLGAVKGFYPQKNVMSAMIVFAILTFVFAKPKGLPSWLRNITLIGACVLLVLSNSATSFVALGFCLAMYPGIHLLRVSRPKTLPLWIALLPVLVMSAWLVIANFDFVAEAVGRNSTLTDRIPMWKEVLHAIGRHPWLGYGFDRFWTEWSDDLAKVIYMLGGYRPPHAHNGYLDVLLSLGIVGLLVFIGGLITALWRAAQLFKADEIHAAKWPLFVLMFFTVVNLGESFILRLMSFFWIPFVSIYVSMAMMQAEAAQLAPARRDVQAGEVADDGGIVPEYQT